MIIKREDEAGDDLINILEKQLFTRLLEEYEKFIRDLKTRSKEQGGSSKDKDKLADLKSLIDLDVI